MRRQHILLLALVLSLAFVALAQSRWDFFWPGGLGIEAPFPLVETSSSGQVQRWDGSAAGVQVEVEYRYPVHLKGTLLEAMRTAVNAMAGTHEGSANTASVVGVREAARGDFRPRSKVGANLRYFHLFDDLHDWEVRIYSDPTVAGAEATAERIAGSLRNDYSAYLQEVIKQAEATAARPAAQEWSTVQGPSGWSLKLPEPIIIYPQSPDSPNWYRSGEVKASNTIVSASEFAAKRTLRESLKAGEARAKLREAPYRLVGEFQWQGRPTADYLLCLSPGIWERSRVVEISPGRVVELRMTGYHEVDPLWEPTMDSFRLHR